MSVNISYPDLDFEEILAEGERRLQRKADEHEADKLGILRGGNSGCIVGVGDVLGCHRSAIARAVGYDIPPDFISRRFFDAGNGNEEIFGTYVNAGWDGVVRAEEEIPVKWELSSGRAVTGRPDFFLLEQDGETKRLGIELKTICSVNAAHSRWYDRTPDPKHLCQAAHYSWQHNTPWVLTYCNNIRFDTNHWARKKHGLGWKQKIEPFRSHYYLTIRDGTLYYKDSSTGKDIKTIITVEGIQQYYELVEECIETKSLYLNPVSRYADGTDMPYKHENYCDACKAATKAKGNWNKWLDELSTTIEEKRGT